MFMKMNAYRTQGRGGGKKGEKTELGVTAFTENDRQNKPLPVKQLSNASDAMDSQTTERIVLHFIRHTSYQLDQALQVGTHTLPYWTHALPHRAHALARRSHSLHRRICASLYLKRPLPYWS